jgi:hypothetical protein
VQRDPIPTWVALGDAGVQNRQNQIMQNWLRRKELVSPPYDKRGIFAKQDLEFHAGDLVGSEHRQECLKCEAGKLGTLLNKEKRQPQFKVSFEMLSANIQ